MKRLLIAASVIAASTVLLPPTSSLARPVVGQPPPAAGQGKPLPTGPVSPTVRLPDGLIQVQSRRARHGSGHFTWHGRRFNRVRGPAFRYPPGFRAHRWHRGAILPPTFMASPFFWDDWRRIGIGPPPPGRRWVRYGQDLLLVNTRTRRVEDVIPRVFF